MARSAYFLAILGMFVLLFSGCNKNKEETIDNVPVKDIPVSEPPEVELPKPEPVVLDSNGIYLADDTITYYQAVVPIGAIEISRNAEETRFYVKNMNSMDAKKFVEKFFPYQNKEYYPAVDIMEVYRSMNPKYDNGNIVPDLDKHVVKPDPERTVAITIFHNKNKGWYEWVYKDPDYVPPPAEEFGPDKLEEEPEENQGMVEDPDRGW